MTINIAMLQAVKANEGADTVAVVHYAKRWRLLGHFVGAGDQVRQVNCFVDEIFSIVQR